jgi:hypothetical protein
VFNERESMEEDMGEGMIVKYSAEWKTAILKV